MLPRYDVYLVINDRIRQILGVNEHVFFDYKNINKTGRFTSNLQYRFIMNQQTHQAHHHPEFLQEILNMGEFRLVEYILYQMAGYFVRKGYVSAKFGCDFNDLLTKLKTNSVVDWSHFRKDVSFEMLSNKITANKAQMSSRSSFIVSRYKIDLYQFLKNISDGELNLSSLNIAI